MVFDSILASQGGVDVRRGLSAETPARHCPPAPRPVVGPGRQGQLHRHLRQAATAEAPHPALFFQHPQDRFDDGLAPLLDRSPHRSGSPHPPAAVQFARQHRVRQIHIDSLRFPGLQVVQGKEAAVRADLLRPRAAAFHHRLPQRDQPRVVRGLLPYLWLDNQRIFTDTATGAV